MSPSPVVLTVRARRALARPALRRLGVAGLGLATALTVLSLVSAAGEARDQWGETRRVAVATRDLAPGDVLDAAGYETRDLPAAAVADAALAEPPPGAVVRQPILAGEAVVAERLSPAGLTGAAALVGPGERAVAVPHGPVGTPPVAVGDRVDLLAVLPGGARGGTGAASYAVGDDGPPAFPLVEQAAVIDVTEQAVTVAVPEGDAPRVAWAVSYGSLVLALAGA